MENIKAGIFPDAEEILNLCKNDPRKLRKLQGILQQEFCRELDSKMANKMNDDFDLNLEINKKGEILPNSKNIWSILRILDDDLLNSFYSKIKYIVHSKEKN